MNISTTIDRLEQLAWKHHTPVEVNNTARRLELHLSYGTFYASLPEDVEEVPC